MEKVLGQSELDILNTIINYNSFDKYSDNCANYPLITAAKHKLNGEFWKNNISDKLLNALCYVYIREENKTKNENLCSYLYYWLGSKVLKNLRVRDFFSEVIRIIYDILSKGELRKVCNPVEYSINDDNFQKFKDIFDLSEIYNNYRLHFIKVNPSCDKNYDDAIKKYQVLYKKLRNECTIEGTNRYEQYCEAFNNYFTEDKNAQIFSWTCHLTKTEEQGQQIEEEHREHSGKEKIPERPSVGRPQIKGDWDETAQHSRSIVSYLNKELFDGESFSSTSEYSSPSTIKKSITSAVSAAGVSWINKLLGRNQIYRNPLTERELIENSYKPYQFDSEKNRYNISYRPE